MSRRTRFMSVVTTSALTAGVILVASTGADASGLGGAAAPAPRPVKTSEEKIPLTASAAAVDPGTLRSAAADATTPEFELPTATTVVGASWRGALSPAAVLEVRSKDKGRWGAWTAMPREDDAPASTEPIVVIGSHAQVRATGVDLSKVAINAVVVDPGQSAADQTASQKATQDTGAASQSSQAALADGAARPAISSRRQWGADESIRRDDPSYGQAQLAVIHHTAGANGYSSGSVPSILRGIYSYHVKTNGWDDIGYNILVDRFGRAWEGRAGGVDKAVVGAHAVGINSSSFGVSALGTFTSTGPSSQMVGAITAVVAWKMSVHGIPATGTVSAAGGTYNRISGHRDIKGNSTACPGAAMYRQFGGIRKNASARMGRLAKVTGARSWDAGGRGDLLDHTGPGTARLSQGQTPMPVAGGAATIGTGWQRLDDIVMTDDVTGDGRADIIARSPAENNVRIYHGNGRGGFARSTSGGGGWNVFTSLVAAGDRTGDGRADLVAIRKDGAIVMYAGDGRGWFAQGKQIGSGAGGFRAWTRLSDLDRDGRDEMLAIRAKDNALVRWTTKPDGSLNPLTVISTGWGGISALAAAGDLDRDGADSDLIARENAGRMRTYYGQGRSILSRYNFWGGGWQKLDHIGSGVDWNGDGRPDVLARKPANGDLVLYPGTGTRDFNVDSKTVSTVAGATMVTLLGDVDGDGRADAVARNAGGDLYALKGTSSGFSTVKKIGTGWNMFSRIAAGADYTRDGVPDILALTPGGVIRVYALKRDWSYSWISVIETGAGGMRDVAGVGSVNADFNSDVVTLRSSDGALLLWRGSGPAALGDAQVIATGRSDLRSIEGVGDLNGDGFNDVLGRDASGRGWIFPGTGSGLSGRGQPVTVP